MARNLLAVLLAALAFASAFHAADAQDFNQGNPECIREDASTGILEAAAEVDELSILVAAVEAAGAQDAFEDTSVKVTAFMPTNEAFNNLVAELGLNNVNELLASPLLPNILRYHVVGDPHTSDYFVEGVELPTREGDETLQGYDETTIVAANGNATIMKSDVYTCQGVVEVIDKVMLPPSVFDALEGSSNESTGNSTVAVGGGPPVAGGGGGSDGSGEESDGGHPCTKCPGECVGPRGSLKAEASLMRVAPSARTATSGGPVGAMAPPREDVYALLTLTLKRGSVRTVRDWLMAQMTALTATTTWRALLPTQTLESASAPMVSANLP